MGQNAFGTPVKELSSAGAVVVCGAMTDEGGIIGEKATVVKVLDEEGTDGEKVNVERLLLDEETSSRVRVVNRSELDVASDIDGIEIVANVLDEEEEIVVMLENVEDELLLTAVDESEDELLLTVVDEVVDELLLTAVDELKDEVLLAAGDEVEDGLLLEAIDEVDVIEEFVGDVRMLDEKADEEVEVIVILNVIEGVLLLVLEGTKSVKDAELEALVGAACIPTAWQLILS